MKTIQQIREQAQSITEGKIIIPKSKKDMNEIGKRGRTATGQKANKINSTPEISGAIKRRLETYRRRGM